MPFVRATKLNAYLVLARKVVVHARAPFLIPIFQRLYGRALAALALFSAQSARV